MQDIYLTFEFDKIKEHLVAYNKTELGKLYSKELKKLPNFESIENSLLDLKEISSIIVRFGPLPIVSSANALKLIEIAKKTALLTPRDLNLIAEDVLTIVKISAFLKKIDSANYPRINNLTNGFIDLSNLEKEIHRVITRSLTIADNATPELLQIRNKLKKAEDNLQSKIASLAFQYAKYLNDDNFTIRDGHFVLPVKTTEKSRVNGVIYDVSDTGNTTFIEPLEIVQLNNEITSLKVEENEEVRKILKALTALVLLQEKEIITNNKIIAELDFLSAKALYANEINAEIATCSTEQIIDLKEARHPLIDASKVVANSFYLDEDKPIIIISGPNAGGKTVALKTVGLLTLMHHSALAVPALKATIGYFKNIYIDIGDNQSLSDNLSTFSAHVSQIGEIVRVVGAKDLVLLDELGTGTDPREGESLAVSITKYLESKRCLVLISSHFNALKEYAFISLKISNGSMIFDEHNLAPTYRFKQGVPGKSYALEVASRYGMDSKIIKEAQIFLESHQQNETAELLDILQRKIEETDQLQFSLNQKESEINKREKQLSNAETIFENRRENLLKDVKIEKAKLIAETKKEISEIISKLHHTDLKVHEVIELKKDLEKLEEIEEEEIFDEDIKLHDYVAIPSMNIVGKVTRIKGEKVHIVSDSGFTFDVAKNKLQKINAPKTKPSKVRKVSDSEPLINTKVGIELNLIGMRVEEARNTLIKYLDNCRIKRFTQVRIIHGFGSGALRQLVRNYLKTQKDLTYRPGGEYEGGGGCTVVMFNP
ncbi:MAG TPA: hypothetical protein GX010_00715 [Erysipelotrichaceae bacterium]|nr:hypothetical protein [Erysipelotrichaceae bacterium]